MDAIAPIGIGYTKFLSVGMTLAVICSEDAPAFTEGEIAGATGDTFLGPARARNQLRICGQWPKAAIPATFWEPVESKTPILMISGELDPIDGLDLALGAARHLANATHVIIPSGSHQPQFPGCLRDLAQAFIAAGSENGLDFSCVQEIKRPAFTRQ